MGGIPGQSGSELANPNPQPQVVANQSPVARSQPRHARHEVIAPTGEFVCYYVPYGGYYYSPDFGPLDPELFNE